MEGYMFSSCSVVIGYTDRSLYMGFIYMAVRHVRGGDAAILVSLNANGDFFSPGINLRLSRTRGDTG